MNNFLSFSHNESTLCPSVGRESGRFRQILKIEIVVNGSDESVSFTSHDFSRLLVHDYILMVIIATHYDSF